MMLVKTASRRGGLPCQIFESLYEKVYRRETLEQQNSAERAGEGRSCQDIQSAEFYHKKEAEEADKKILSEKFPSSKMRRKV